MDEIFEVKFDEVIVLDISSSLFTSNHGVRFTVPSPWIG